MQLNAAAPSQSAPLLKRLSALCGHHGDSSLEHRLGALAAWVHRDMALFEDELASADLGTSLVGRSASHLLDLDGKHLRPMCVVLASKLGTGFDTKAQGLAMAVELVHSATLLHDDVVDHGDMRRGRPTSRVLYGNAASIFAGDWLLVKALQCIRRSGNDHLLGYMLEIIDEMILAESLQLESRGRLNTGLEDYFRIVEGKTAALFRWAMYAGAVIAGVSEPNARALEAFGLHLGVAFQAVDDLLDVEGDAIKTGKSLFADLHEGKMTYPLIVAMERDPHVTALLQSCMDDSSSTSRSDIDEILDRLHRTGAIEDCRRLAQHRARQAKDSLACLADGPGKQALLTVADAATHREV